MWCFCTQMSQPRSTQCGPCSLCKQESARYSHPQNWEPQTRIHYMLLLNIQDYETRHICICRACHHDLTQNITKPGYIPRSIKISNKQSISQEKCTVAGCSNQADFKSTDSINFEDIPEGIDLSLTNNSATPSLCASHYHKLYKYQHKKQVNCTTVAK